MMERVSHDHTPYCLYLGMNHIEGANDSKDREGIVKHLIGDAFGHVPDIDCESILLLYGYFTNQDSAGSVNDVL